MGSCKRCERSYKEKRHRRPYRDEAFLRVVHNVAGAPNVDVYVDGRRVLTNVAYKQVSPYLGLSSGRYTVAVFATGETRNPLIKGKVSVRDGKFYTAIAVGSVSDLSGLSLLVAKNDSSCPKKGSGKLRFIHGSGDAPAVNVLVDGDVVLRNVSFRDISAYLKLEAPKKYNIVVETAKERTKVLETSLVLGNRENVTVLASGIPGNTATPLKAIPLVDNDETCTITF